MTHNYQGSHFCEHKGNKKKKEEEKKAGVQKLSKAQMLAFSLSAI